MVSSNRNLSFRPIEQSDEPLLLSIYSSTRAEEMALVPNWSSETRSAFLQQQFQAQHAFYQLQYPDAAFMIILFDQLPIGRLYINRGVEDIRIIDITLLPDFRNHGYGEYLLNTFLDEADVSKKMVSIHVERNNRALNLYERLGFVVLEDNHPIYLLLGRPLKSK